MEKKHEICTKNSGINIPFNLYGMDWWMNFISNHKIYDVNFHAEEIRYYKIMGCRDISFKRSDQLKHNGKKHKMKINMRYARF
jgi:hypothetical protein